MESNDEREVTNLLLRWRGGDRSALAKLMPLVYDQLKEIAEHLMRGQRGRGTIQSTGLVHEAYLRIVDLDRISWQDRAHFFAMSARLMRRVLVDHARHHGRAKRGGGEPKVSADELPSTPQVIEPDLLELDEALRELTRLEPQMSQIVEYRFFGGLNRNEIAEVIGISSATVHRRWRAARAWLGDYFSETAS